MSEENVSGVEFTPQETAYFESGGTAEIPAETVVEKEKVSGEEPTQATAPEAEKADKAEKVVPLAALHEERNRRKEIERREREREVTIARLEEQLKAYTQQSQRQQQPDQPPPSFDEDFISAGKHVDEQVKTLKQEFDTLKTAKQQEEFQRALMQAYRADADRVRAETPEFEEAYKWLNDHRRAEMIELGNAIGFDANYAEQLLRNDEWNIVTTALRSGKSPSKALMAIAKARGFKPASAKADPAVKLEAIEKGQAANKSLSSAGGDAGGDVMTAERAVKMSPEEFDAWCVKHPAQAKRLMGG